MSILTKLTAGAPFKDPREGQGTTIIETTVAEIGLAAGTLDWFSHDLIMMQHCQQTPPRYEKTIKQITRIFLDQWSKGKGPVNLSRYRVEAIAEAIWHDFATNQRMTDEERAILCQMSDRQFRRGTNEVYRATLAELNSIARESYLEVKRQLKEDIECP